MFNKKQNLFISTLVFWLLIGSTIPTSASVYVGVIGSSGDTPGKFDGPQNIMIFDDRIYVSEEGNDRVQIFDLDWNYIDQFGGNGAGIGQFVNPIGMANNGTHIFVADAGNHRIEVFNKDGGYVSEFGSLGTGLGELDTPIGVAIADDKIFVTEYTNDRIQVFNSTTFDHLNYIGAALGVANLDKPRGLDIHEGEVFVVDALNTTINRYSTDGSFVGIIESPNTINPWDVQIVNDRIFISDINGGIEMYDMGYNFIRSISYEISDSLRFMEITDQYLYVSEYYDDEISQFRLVATPENVIVSEGVSSISLSWSISPENGLTHPETYEIYRKTNSSAFDLLATTMDLNYVDHSAKPNEKYTYQIKALSSTGESDFITSDSAELDTGNVISDTTTDESDTGSFFSSLPVNFMSLVTVFALIPIIRKYKQRV